MLFRKSKVPKAVIDPTHVETEAERNKRLAAKIAELLDERFAKETASNIYLGQKAMENAAKRAKAPADRERIPIYPGVKPAFVQMQELSIKNGNPHMEGVRWVDYKGAKETRVHRSFEVHPLKMVEIGAPSKRDVAGRTKRFWKGSKHRWEISSTPERQWILEDSDRKIGSDERPIEFKPRKPVGHHGLEKAVNGEVGRNQALWPQWFASGERPNANARPTETLPAGESYAMTLPKTGNIFEAVQRYAAGNNEYAREFKSDLIGLSWTGMVQNSWDDLDYKTRLADGSLPPKLDCQITESWDYVGEGGNTGKSWLEERRYNGVLVDVAIHDTKSMVRRLQTAFAPTASVAGITCIPAENVAWQVPDAAGPAIPVGS